MVLRTSALMTALSIPLTVSNKHRPITIRTMERISKAILRLIKRVVFKGFESPQLLLLCYNYHKFYKTALFIQDKMVKPKIVKKVIVADDHPSWREIYVGTVKNAFPDVHVDVVETGRDLVERVVSGDYSLAISDNDMEEEGAGIKALRTLREAGNNIPLYIVSGGSSDVARNALRYGASGFYTKTEFDSATVVTEIAQYLQ